MTDRPDTVEQEDVTGGGAEAATPADSATPGGAVPGGAQPAGAGAEAPGEPAAGAPYETPDEMAERIKELTTDLQRLQAEYVNYKRRVDRDRLLVQENARLAVLTALFPVLDDIERAREHEELTGGFKVITDSLEKVVADQGLVKYGAPGDPFDPRLHEALMHGHSPEVTQTVCDKIVQVGYTLGERVVRAAKVTVLDPEPGTAPGAAPAAEGQG